MKTYVLTLAKTFPAAHPRAGEATFFKERMYREEKEHTLRANYPLWEKRFNEVYEGKACISVREWSGIPYRSKQIELARLYYPFNPVALSPVKMWKTHNRATGKLDRVMCAFEGAAPYSDMLLVAKNDGLSLPDFENWFLPSLTSEPQTFALIQFKYRQPYSNKAAKVNHHQLKLLKKLSNHQAYTLYKQNQIPEK